MYFRTHRTEEQATKSDWYLFCFFSLLSCLINCEKTASVSTRISLTTKCTGHACDAAKYQWQLVSLHPSHGAEIKEGLTRDMTDTELNLPGIIIKANQLNGSFTYRLKVTATPGIGPAGNAAYQFRMNAPPHSGLCTVSSGNEKALNTKFEFRCTGWQVRKITFQMANPDLPISSATSRGVLCVTKSRTAWKLCPTQPLFFFLTVGFLL